MKKIRWAAIAIVVCVCAVIDHRVIGELYGNGPPYYGRTVNMDKWTSPAPIPLAIQGIGLAAIGLVLWRTRLRKGAITGAKERR